MSAKPNYEAMRQLLELSDAHIGEALSDIIRPLCDRGNAVDQLAGVGDVEKQEAETEFVKRGLHKALDFVTHGALASGVVMQVLRMEWERLGGKSDDPAPWREDSPFVMPW